MRQLVHIVVLLGWAVAGQWASHLQAQAPANTLVTGVILDQNGRSTIDPLVVRVMADKKKLAEVRSREGLFQVDLSGLAEPDAEITVVIRPQGYELAQAEKAREYSGTSLTTSLAKAQNLQLRVNFDYLKVESTVGPYSELPAR